MRECLTIRQKLQPAKWSTFNAQSLLGESLLGQKKFTEAEPLLVAGYEGMKKQEAEIPPDGRVRLPQAIERLVSYYEATGKKDKADEWRKKLPAGNSETPSAK